MKKLLVLLVLIVGVASFSIAQQVTLTFLYDGVEHSVQVMRNLISEYEVMHPSVKIDLEVLGSGAMKQKLNTMIIGGVPPDMAWTTEIIPYQDVALNIKPYISNFQEFFKNFKNFCSMDYWYEKRGEILGIPTTLGAHVLFYNKDEFEKAGITAPSTEPWTWEQWKSAMEKIVNNEVARYGLVYEKSSYRWDNLLYQAGGQIWNKNDQCIVNSPEGVRTLTFFDSLFKERLAPSSVWISTAPAISYFLNGSSAMLFSGTWSISKLIGSKLSFKWGVMPLPTDKVNAVMIGIETLIGFKATKHPKEVADFMLWFTSKSILSRWAKEVGEIPARHDLLAKGIEYENPKLREVMNIIMKDLNSSLATSQGNWPANFYRDWVTGGDIAAISNQYSAKGLRYNNDIVNTILGTMSPKQALDDMAKYFDERLADLKASK